MIILRSPKGWTGPAVVDGVQVVDSWRSHQVPLSRRQGQPGASADLAGLARVLPS